MKLWDAGAACWDLMLPHSLHAHLSPALLWGIWTKKLTVPILIPPAHAQFEEKWPEQVSRKPKENCSQIEPPVLLAPGKSRRKMGQCPPQSRVPITGQGGEEGHGSWKQSAFSHGPGCPQLGQKVVHSYLLPGSQTCSVDTTSSLSDKMRLMSGNTGPLVPALL